MQKTLKWTPAQPFKRTDNIISSKARETGDVGFTPEYLSEPKEDMWFIMSNEYRRIWYKDRGIYEKNTYSKEQIIKEESKIKRRFVQRMMTYKKPDKNEFLEEKIQKILKKGDTKGQIDDYKKFKYKPVCQKPKENVVQHASGKTSEKVKNENNRSHNSEKSKVTHHNKKKQTHQIKHPEDDQRPVIFYEANPTCAPCCPIH